MSNPMKNLPRRPVILIILDGFGLNPAKANNAIAIAQTPTLDRYFSSYPHTSIQASGLAVGLPDGQMGNSEVGHMSLGSGCVVRQDLVLIDEAIADHSFFENPVLVAAARAAAAQGRPIHFMGLVSDGGVHSHVNHLVALIKLCKYQGARPMVHLFADGRDTPPRSVLNYLNAVEGALEIAGGRIATVSGRYYAMDRDNRWERTELAWRAMVDGEGRHAASARAAIEAAYAAGEDDEFIRPTVIEGAQLIEDGDQVIHINFRKDRPRQMVAAFFKPDFDHFDRRGVTGVKVTCMMEYDEWFGLPFAFDHDMPKVTLGKILSDDGLPQFHCAETEKYAHVTFFFNGGAQRSLSGRGADTDSLAQGGDLRSATRDERAGGGGRGDRGAPAQGLSLYRGQLRQWRHGRAYRRARSGHRGGRGAGPRGRAGHGCRGGGRLFDGPDR